MIRFFALFAALSPLYFGSAFGQEFAKITKFGVIGSGCPLGSSHVTLLPDETTLLATFPKYNATTEGSIIDVRKNCQFTLSMEVPAGKQYAVQAVEYGGFIDLKEETTLLHETFTYFPGDISQSVGRGTKEGPRSGFTSLANTFPEPLWSPCGQSNMVNINTHIYISDHGRVGSGSAKVDAARIGPFELRDC